MTQDLLQVYREKRFWDDITGHRAEMGAKVDALSTEMAELTFMMI